MEGDPSQIIICFRKVTVEIDTFSVVEIPFSVRLVAASVEPSMIKYRVESFELAPMPSA